MRPLLLALLLTAPWGSAHAAATELPLSTCTEKMRAVLRPVAPKLLAQAAFPPGFRLSPALPIQRAWRIDKDVDRVYFEAVLREGVAYPGASNGEPTVQFYPRGLGEGHFGVGVAQAYAAGGGRFLVTLYSRSGKNTLACSFLYGAFQD